MGNMSITSHGVYSNCDIDVRLCDIDVGYDAAYCCAVVDRRICPTDPESWLKPVYSCTPVLQISRVG